MGTRHRGPADEVRALDLFIKLMRAADSVATRVHRAVADANLTVTQFGVLEAVFHLGPMCQKALGTKLLKSGGNITLVVGNLEKRGWVRRKRNPENRKFVTVSLTDAGRRLIERVFPRHVAEVVREVAVLTADEQAALAALLRTLGRGRVRLGATASS
jgi:MarR family 2-MHQ and catechol resistance regulon transcriptional repressor